MATTTKEVSAQVSSLQSRINQLVDEIHNLKNEMQRFKSDVANDVKYLTDRVDGGR